MRNLAVGVETGQRHITEMFCDQRHLRRVVAELVAAPAETTVIQARLDSATGTLVEIPEHAQHVLACSFSVAPAEHDRGVVLEDVADGQQLLPGVDADQVAHQVVAGVGTGYRQSGKNVTRGTAQVARQNFTDVLTTNIGHRLARGDVAIYPWESPRTVDRQVVIQVTRFIASGDRVFLDARWRILNRNGNQVRSETISLVENTDGQDYDAIVSAMSRLVGRFADRIVQAL